MKTNAVRPSSRSASALLALCLALAGFCVSAEAKKDQCEGTKEERKQKFAPRSMSDEKLASVVAAYEKTVAADLEGVRQAATRRLEREFKEHEATGAPFVYDVLVLSGGGSKGAFGTGFLEGWGTVKDGPDARPEFDMVTGVSTGALIAPFAFIGTDEAYSSIASLYANPEEDWAKKRGWLFFLPKHASLFNTCHLKDAIHERAAPGIVEAVGAGAAEDRLLLVGVTNLDIGRGRAIDLGHIALSRPAAEAREEIVDALLASSAIPGAFPPVLIDGMLYADGGATSNLFIVTFPGPGGPLSRFKETHPGAALPKIRLWVIVNQKLMAKQESIQPRWVSVSGQGLSVLTATSQRFALNAMRQMMREARDEKGLDVEMRLVSIPDSGPEPATPALFEKAYMIQLQELGRAMGADPSSWATTLPSAFAADDIAGN